MAALISILFLSELVPILKQSFEFMILNCEE